MAPLATASLMSAATEVRVASLTKRAHGHAEGKRVADHDGLGAQVDEIRRIERCTYSRLAAMHTWPEVRKVPHIVVVMRSGEEVGVGEEDRRIVAAEVQHYRRDGVSGRAHHGAADGGAAVNAILRTRSP